MPNFAFHEPQRRKIVIIPHDFISLIYCVSLRTIHQGPSHRHMPLHMHENTRTHAYTPTPTSPHHQVPGNCVRLSAVMDVALLLRRHSLLKKVMSDHFQLMKQIFGVVVSLPALLPYYCVSILKEDCPKNGV